MTSDASTFSDFDKTCMAEALRLAAKGCFTTSPNPNVGCVIAAANAATGDMSIVGRGYHQQAGTPHAEVHALAQAGARAEGAVAYVTLEPCSHFGRTPPCADALIKARVARVVVAMQDPYHEVAGRGLEKLRNAGIDVAVGLFAAQAAALNRGFIKRATTGLPYVRLKMASTMDGRTALANGYSKWITGAAARHDVQYGRALSSAILTGAGTVLADDPLLNVRLSADEYQAGATLQRVLASQALYAELEPWLQEQDSDKVDAQVPVRQPAIRQPAIRQPVRVVVDNRSEVHEHLHLWSVDAPVWLASPAICVDNLRAELPAQGEFLGIQTRDGESRIDLHALMTTLAQRGINDVWIEAGSRLGGALLAHGLVDEMVLYMAPKLMGPHALSLIDLPLLSAMDQVPTFAFESMQKVGEDMKIVVRVGAVK